jgi:hypothetical protein
MTISFNQLGNFGNLGNQMFQYATLKGIAIKNGYDWSIPPKDKFGTTYPMRSNIYDTFSLPNLKEKNINVSNNVILAEKYFHFDEDLFNNCPNNVDLYGYYQSYKYFEHIKDELLQDFTFKVQDVLMDIPYVAIHVRRGDYLALSEYHPTCGLDYYVRAMEYFPEHKFLLFSDDIEWCKQQEIFKECFFSDGANPGNDLFLMSIAEHNIIANSSFSWWGAWLNNNPNKIVICPKEWFGEILSHNTKDLIPEKWIQL